MPQCVQDTLTCCRTRTLTADDGATAGNGGLSALDGGPSDGGLSAVDGGSSAGDGGLSAVDGGGGAAGGTMGGGCLYDVFLQVAKCLIRASLLINVDVQ
ncbi:hypothetical protein PO909_021875 [Leuciscus waleckii]